MTRTGRKWKTVRTDAMTGIKQAIRDELEATGMTQADLAAYCGLSQKHVSQMLTGKVTGTFDVLAKMAAACGMAITVRRAEEPAQEPPPRDPTSTTSAHIERADQFDFDKRRPASRAFGFGKVLS